MLGGEVYVGFPFAEQLDRIAVFVFAQLINPVTFNRYKLKLGNSYSRAANRLQNLVKPFVMLALRRLAWVFLFAFLYDITM